MGIDDFDGAVAGRLGGQLAALVSAGFDQRLQRCAFFGAVIRADVGCKWGLIHLDLVGGRAFGSLQCGYFQAQGLFVLTQGNGRVAAAQAHLFGRAIGHQGAACIAAFGA